MCDALYWANEYAETINTLGLSRVVTAVEESLLRYRLCTFLERVDVITIRRQNTRSNGENINILFRMTICETNTCGTLSDIPYTP